MEKETNLNIEIIITNVNNLTEKEKAILRMIAGEHLEAPTLKAVENTKTPKTTTIAVKPEKIVEVKEVAPEVVKVVPTTPVAVEPKTDNTLPVVTNIETLNEYARMTVTAANGQHFKALLKEYNVKKFKDIPEDKVLEVKAKLDEIIENVVA